MMNYPASLISASDTCGSSQSMGSKSSIYFIIARKSVWNLCKLRKQLSTNLIHIDDAEVLKDDLRGDNGNLDGPMSCWEILVWAMVFLSSCT